MKARNQPQTPRNTIPLHKALARQQAREAFSVVLLMGTVVMVVSALGASLSFPPRWELGYWTLSVVPMTWGLALLVGGVVRVWGASRGVSHGTLGGPRTPTTGAELQLSSVDPKTYEGRLKRSLALPLVAISLFAPLSLHWLLFVGADTGHRDFAEWVMMSCTVVGHAHLALAFMAFRFARRLGDEAPEDDGFTLGFRALATTTGVAALPGVILFLLPPVITFATGLLFVPWMFMWAGRAWNRERAAPWKFS